MTVPAPVLVGLGGAVGALARYWVGELLADHPASDRFPAPTVAVNVLGTFLLGLLTFAGAGAEATLLVGTGACGAFTTFSSFAFETVRLADDGFVRAAARNAAGTLLLALAGVWIGAAVVAWLAG